MTPKRYFAVVNFSPRYNTEAYKETEEYKVEKKVFLFCEKVKNKIIKKKG